MNEDFVPFELAKKLKEKGFQQDYNIFGYKPIYSNNTTIKYISDIGAYDKEYFGENISCPTISQVLKWLREEKKIYIEISPQWQYTVYDMRCNPWIGRSDMQNYDDYMKASIAGIEYVIDNLI